MKEEVLKCKRIKSIIEEASGHPDIGIESRKKTITELKKIYSKLCKIFTSATYEDIGKALGGYHHATILNNIKVFDDLLQIQNLDHKLIYESIFDFLQKEREDRIYKTFQKHTPSEIASKVNRESLRLVVEKTKELINTKNERIEHLEKVILDISEAFKSEDALSKEYVFEVKAKINLIVLKNNL